MAADRTTPTDQLDSGVELRPTPQLTSSNIERRPR
jgi:hypothetical protein